MMQTGAVLGFFFGGAAHVQGLGECTHADRRGVFLDEKSVLIRCVFQFFFKFSNFSPILAVLGGPAVPMGAAGRNF